MPYCAARIGLSSAMRGSGGGGASGVGGRNVNVLYEVLDPECAHAPQRHAAHHRIVVAAALLQCVDGQQGEVRVRLGVVAKVQVDQFLLDQVVSRLNNEYRG